MSQECDHKDLIDDSGKNKLPVLCVRCPSKILISSAAEYVEREEQEHLPVMMQKKDLIKDEVESEPVTQFWLVKNKFTFENVGFSNSVSGKKYLICADCEIGPIGWYDEATEHCFVSLNRIKYEKNDKTQ